MVIGAKRVGRRMGFCGGVNQSAPFDCVFQSFNFGFEETLVWLGSGWVGGGLGWVGLGSAIPSTPF